jgi:hypothetical protein
MSEWRRYSRLPRSPDYWDGVTARMQQSVHAMGEVPEESAWSLVPLAWTAIAAALAAVIASTALPVAPATSVSLYGGLTPADSAAAEWLDNSQPPSAGDLLLTQLAGLR